MEVRTKESYETEIAELKCKLEHLINHKEDLKAVHNETIEKRNQEIGSLEKELKLVYAAKEEVCIKLDKEIQKIKIC